MNKKAGVAVIYVGEIWIYFTNFATTHWFYTAESERYSGQFCHKKNNGAYDDQSGREVKK